MALQIDHIKYAGSSKIISALCTKINAVIDAAGSGGGGGTDDYTALSNKPQINGIELTGNKTPSDLNIKQIQIQVTGEKMTFTEV